MLDLVLDHLWQSTLFAIGAGLMSLALRRQSAKVRYWVWFGASLKFLIPLIVLTILGAQLSWRTGEPTETDGTRWQQLAVSVIQPMSELESEETIAAIRTDSQRSASSLLARSSLDIESLVFSSTFWFWLTAASLAGWALGTLTIAAIWTRRWIQLNSLANRATPLAVDVPEAEGIDIRSIKASFEPGVYGIFRPVLLLPEGLIDRLSPPQLAAVVRHEHCHIQRRDNLTALIQMIVAGVFWFHPLVWWIGSRLIEERERACDEAVLAAGFEPNAYAGGILEVCSFYLDSPLPCASGVGGGSLKHRMRRIAANRPMQTLGATGKAILLSLPGAALLAPFWIGLATSTPAHAQAIDTGDSNQAVQDFLARRAYFAGLGPLIWGPVANNSEVKFAIRLTVCEEFSQDSSSTEAGDVSLTPPIESIQELIAYAFDVENDQVNLPEDLKVGLVTAMREEQRIDHASCRASVQRSLLDDYGLIVRVESDENRVMVDGLNWPGSLPDLVALSVPGVEIDPEILDGYTGYFARPNTESTFLTPIFEVRREGQALLIEWNGERLELAATSQTDFSAPEYLLPVFRERYVSLGRTERPIIYGTATRSDGNMVSVELDQPMYEFRFDSNDELSIFNDAEKRNFLEEPVALARRINIDVAEAMIAELAHRRAQTLPNPASESLVRTIVESLRLVEFANDAIATVAAYQLREQLEQIEPGLASRLGDPRIISLREVLPSGRDVYDVVFDQIAMRVTIGSDVEGRAMPLAVNIDCQRQSQSHIDRFGGCRSR